MYLFLIQHVFLLPNCKWLYFKEDDSVIPLLPTCNVNLQHNFNASKKEKKLI